MQAFIFDFDGVIVDSEKYWSEQMQGWCRELAPHRQEHAQFTGLSVDAAYTLMQTEYGITMTKADFLHQGLEFSEAIYAVHAEPMAGIREYIEQLSEHRVPMAIASSGYRRNIEKALERLDLRRFFHSISCYDDVPGRAKPHPDVYLLAAQRLGADPLRCTALEDSATGIQSAKAAGLHVLGLRTPLNADIDLSQADVIIEHPQHIRIDDLRAHHAARA
jgi:HAD superfamily hydrolase (TIGR01509 family)